MQIFVKSECDYVWGEMSVGMFATPLTLSAAALSWIPWLNFNRCSTMRIRQGDLAVLFHRVAHSACIMRMSPCVFGFYFFFFCEDAVCYVTCRQMHRSLFLMYLHVFLSAVCMREAGGCVI